MGFVCKNFILSTYVQNFCSLWFSLHRKLNAAKTVQVHLIKWFYVYFVRTLENDRFGLKYFQTFFIHPTPNIYILFANNKKCKLWVVGDGAVFR